MGEARMNEAPNGFFVDVGSKMSMELNGLDFKLTASVVGFVKSKFLVTSIPLATGLNRQHLLQHLYNGNGVTVRYLREGSVMGFKSEILQVLFSPFPLLFLEYPARVESVNLRKFPRINCFFPAMALIKEERRPSFICNVSQAGCCLFIDRAVATTGLLDIDDFFAVECPTLFDVETAVRCKVQRLGKQRDNVELGAKFVEMTPNTKAKLDYFIRQAVSFVSDSA
jgi:c-di-GMP-binding flagellar brake protein YcgR